MRAHELAKELGLSSKELLASLEEAGLGVKTHASSVSDEGIAAMRSKHGDAETAPQPEEKTQPEPTPAPEPAPAPEPTPEPKPEPVKEESDEQKLERELAELEAAEAEAAAKTIAIGGPMVVKDLAELLKVVPAKVIAELMKLNILASINERVNQPTARLISERLGYTVIEEVKPDPKQIEPAEAEEEEPPEEPEDKEERPPVVTFLGHVDHGKTSLLDRIRNTAVAAGESGGITQHIGAYSIESNGKTITFLDTPGHAAFTAMRARGANLTDIAVIIVAADDGIMPQTKEAISHAKAAGVAIMVAINKIDLPSANVDRVYQQLQTEGLAPEAWGGETICCPVSAHSGEGMDNLLEMISLTAEMLELRATSKRKAQGFVVEAQLEPGMGPVATILVTNGTLKVGDAMLCGCHAGRVKALINDKGERIQSAGPSTPAQCLGLSGVPEAGAAFSIEKNEKKAKQAAQAAAIELKEQQLAAPQKKASLDDLFSQIESEEKIELKLLVKADTQGSIEAIVHSLEEIQSEKINLNIVLAGTGNITTNDVMLASASDAVVVGFHVAKEGGVDKQAKHEGVEIRLHQIIYELLDQVRDAMLGAIGPQLEEQTRGKAQVKQIFAIGKTGQVAGCICLSGRIGRKHRARVMRMSEVLFEGSISSLKHYQNDVAEIREAQECGIRLDGFYDFIEGDIIEFYELVEVAQSL
jgi:translation initiation factor IF-2